MNNFEFIKIKNIKEYVNEGLANGAFELKAYQKTGKINARVGEIGEEIFTIMSNGLKETKNTVTADENGNPGWVVTNLTGEKYIIPDITFRKKYEKIVGTEDEYRPIWNPINAVKIDENLSFQAPWGEMQQLVAGGYLIFNKDTDDIYGVQEEEFISTYELI